MPRFGTFTLLQSKQTREKEKKAPFNAVDISPPRTGKPAKKEQDNLRARKWKAEGPRNVDEGGRVLWLKRGATLSDLWFLE